MAITRVWVSDPDPEVVIVESVVLDHKESDCLFPGQTVEYSMEISNGIHNSGSHQ